MTVPSCEQIICRILEGEKKRGKGKKEIKLERLGWLNAGIEYRQKMLTYANFYFKENEQARRLIKDL